MNRNFFRKNFPAYVISLERTPERLARFRTWNEPANVHVDVFKGVDGSTLDIGALDPSIIVAGTTSYKRGTIGLALSHRALWEKCVASGKPLVVLEDDVVLRRDIKSAVTPLTEGLPRDWELFVLGYNNNAPVEVAMVDDMNIVLDFGVREPDERQLMRFAQGTWPVGMAPLNCFFGVCAYMISPKGAERLLKLCFPLDEREVQIPHLRFPLLSTSFDVRLNGCLRMVQAFACIPQLAMPYNLPGQSERLRIA